MQLDLYQAGIKQASFWITGNEVTFSKLGDDKRDSLTDAMDTEFKQVISQSPLEMFDDFIIDQNFDFTVSPLILPDGRKFKRTSKDYFWIERNRKPAVNLIVQDEQIVGFQISVRYGTTILIKPGFEHLTVLKQWEESNMLLSNPVFSNSQSTEFISMRDGIKLATEVFIPNDGHQTHSTILIRTPYGRQMSFADNFRFVQHGYAVVVQDVRGINDSEGEWLPMYYEREDGEDTINWIADQPWSNQRVGMIGGSYLGYVQWAAASSGTPYLKALVSMVTAGGSFTDTIYRSGAPLSGSSAWFFSTAEKKFDPMRMMRDDWDELLKVRPVKNISVTGLGHEIPGFTTMMNHKHYDELHQNADWLSRADKIRVPALIQSGWFDDNGIGTTEAIRATNDYPKGTRKIILGPWVHSGNAQYDLGPIHLGENSLRFDIDLQHFQWFDHFLNGANNGIDKSEPVEYYTLNQDKWRTAQTFPPKQQASKFYLDAKEGKLRNTLPKNESNISYLYNPDDPTLHLIDVSSNELEFPNDYAEVEQRSDVVSFTTDSFKNPTTITGWFKVNFFASSSAVDTDWVVRLTDITPEGESLNITDGVINAKFRNSLSKPELLKPESIYEFSIETQKTSICLQTGHKLRLDIASAADNLIFPSSNTAEGVDSPTNVIATQTIYTGGKWKSQIEFNEDN